MKKLTLPVICCFITAYSFSQDTLVLYYDAKGHETTADQSMYTRKKFKNAIGWGVMDYYKSGVINMKGSYTDDSCKKRQGEFFYYDEKGNTLYNINFTANVLDGPYNSFYANGKKHTEGFYKSGKIDGEWTGYYESGKPAAKAHYENDKQKSAVFYNEDGSTNRNNNIFYREASYPGGPPALRGFLESELRYPNKALKNEIQGKVIVEFTVEKDGSITGATVVESVEETLDKEAIRVIKRMPKWEPAIVGGILTAQKMRQPVVFALQKEKK